MFNIEKEGNRWTVGLLHGSMSGLAIPAGVWESLQDLVDAPGINIILDLEGISYIDPEGFNILVKITENSIKIGSTVRLCNVGEELSELILIMELEGVFTFCSCKDSEEKTLLVLA
jgi:anti-anti-sigma factor